MRLEWHDFRLCWLWVIIMTHSGCYHDVTFSSLGLNIPRPAKEGEAIWLRVKTGQLTQGAKISVLFNGRILGTIAPFGEEARKSPLFYDIPLPDEVQQKQKLLIQFQLIDKKKNKRAPTSRELLDVELIYLPVTP